MDNLHKPSHITSKPQELRTVNVSVVLPCFGETPYISTAIESVLNQTTTEIELILVLDRPSKRTEKLAYSYSEKDERISVICSERPGISAALNHGISASKGKLIARIDSDDLMMPNRLQKQFKFLEEYPDVVCIGSQISIINSEGKIIRNSNFPTNSKKIKNLLLYRNLIAHPSVMFRKESIVRIGGYNEKFNGSEDYELWLRMIINKMNISNLESCLTKYRIHEGQITGQNKSFQLAIDQKVRIEFLSKKEKQLNSENKWLNKIVLKHYKRKVKTASLLDLAARSGVIQRTIYIVWCSIRNPIDMIRFIFNVLIPNKKRLLR